MAITVTETSAATAASRGVPPPRARPRAGTLRGAPRPRRAATVALAHAYGRWRTGHDPRRKAPGTHSSAAAAPPPASRVPERGDRRPAGPPCRSPVRPRMGAQSPEAPGLPGRSLPDRRRPDRAGREGQRRHHGDGRRDWPRRSVRPGRPEAVEGYAHGIDARSGQVDPVPGSRRPGAARRQAGRRLPAVQRHPPDRQAAAADRGHVVPVQRRFHPCRAWPGVRRRRRRLRGRLRPGERYAHARRRGGRRPGAHRPRPRRAGPDRLHLRHRPEPRDPQRMVLRNGPGPGCAQSRRHPRAHQRGRPRPERPLRRADRERHPHPPRRRGAAVVGHGHPSGRRRRPLPERGRARRHRPHRERRWPHGGQRPPADRGCRHLRSGGGLRFRDGAGRDATRRHPHGGRDVPGRHRRAHATTRARAHRRNQDHLRAEPDGDLPRPRHERRRQHVPRHPGGPRQVRGARGTRPSIPAASGGSISSPACSGSRRASRRPSSTWQART